MLNIVFDFMDNFPFIELIYLFLFSVTVVLPGAAPNGGAGRFSCHAPLSHNQP
jgi:hypothetical protein